MAGYRFAAGEYVFLRHPTMPEVIGMTWTVVSDDGNQVTITSDWPLGDHDQTETYTRSLLVDRTIVFPATFVTADNHQPFIQAVPSAPAGYNDYEWEWVLESIIIETMCLDQWMSLPQFGGNSLLVRAGSSPSPPLVMFPRIDAAGLEIWFHSAWCGGMMQLMEVDVLDLCPQGQI